MPDHQVKDLDKLHPDWMLLSYAKKSDASSTLKQHPQMDAFNEDVRTYWSSKTGEKGEWLSVDLDSQKTINAIQINFTENNTELFGRKGVLGQQYLVEYSADNKTWKTLVDQTNSQEDRTHQFHVLDTPIKARYLKVVNYRVPGGMFAISGFRIFGKGNGKKPDQIKSFEMNRDKLDTRNITLSWKPQPNATGYNIRFGIAPDKMYRSYMVYKNTKITIRSLDKDTKYWFVIDAFGENGITPGINQTE